MLSMIVWGALFFVLIILESVTAQMISIWFAIGSLAAFIVSLFTSSAMIEIVVFLAVSLILLLCTRPFLKKFIKVKHETTNADSFVGQQGITIEEVDNLRNQGRIMVNGLSWNARSAENSIIPKNQTVSIISIEGVTAFVKPVE